MTHRLSLFAGACALGFGLLPASPVRAGNPPAEDRTAILAMQGDYLVDFEFTETVVFQPGYERKPPKHSGGNETVIVVEDTPGHILLQHLLVSDDGRVVTKHWRQDWTYEAPNRFEFTADQTWTRRSLPAARTQGAWTQCVFEVSDAPRYCGTGRWEHRLGVSAWTSDPTWRPLPRREYTTRNDYNAVEAINRHVITPDGWAHEQDNTKTIRDATGRPTGVIVRETGFNDYRKTTTFDFSPARRYWERTAPFWALVRMRWERLLAQGGVHLRTKIDGMAMILPLFDQAARIEVGRPVADAEIDSVFSQWTESTRGANTVTATP